MKTNNVVLNTEIPDTEAASGLPPTAYIFLPNVVLFQMNQTIAIATIAYISVNGIPGKDPTRKILDTVAEASAETVPVLTL